MLRYTAPKFSFRVADRLMTTGWAISEGFVAYPEAVAAMESRAAAIAAGEADELVWLLETVLHEFRTLGTIRDLPR